MDIRTLISKGYRPVECRSCTGKRDRDGRPVAVWVLLVPSRRRAS